MAPLCCVEVPNGYFDPTTNSSVMDGNGPPSARSLEAKEQVLKIVRDTKLPRPIPISLPPMNLPYSQVEESKSRSPELKFGIEDQRSLAKLVAAEIMLNMSQFQNQPNLFQNQKNSWVDRTGSRRTSIGDDATVNDFLELRDEFDETYEHRTNRLNRIEFQPAERRRSSFHMPNFSRNKKSSVVFPSSRRFNTTVSILESPRHNSLDSDFNENEEKRTQFFQRKYPDLYKSFRKYDYDDSGNVDIEELTSYLTTEMSSEIKTADIQRFIREIDNDQDGQISFLELAEWYSVTMDDKTGNEGLSIQRLFTKFTKKVKNLWKPEEQIDMLRIKWYLIHPDSAFHVAWDFMISIFLFITLISLPLSMAFDEVYMTLYSFNLVMDSFFCIDVIKNFFTGFYDTDGVIWMKHRRICTNYISGWFIPDIASSVPIDVILEGFIDTQSSISRGSKSLKLIKLLRMTKLFRLLRMGRVAKYLLYYRRKMEDFFKIRISDGTLRMGKLTCYLLITAHWIGCLQFMICRLMEFPPGSWVYEGAIDKMNWHVQYSWSMYKALGQMIGVGYDVAPITNLGCTDLNDDWCAVEMWVTLASMYMGSIFYAIMISNISSIIFSMNYASRLFAEKSQQLNEYMKNKHLPGELRDKVRDYYSLRYADGKVFDENEIMKDLSPALQRQILIYNSKELFMKVPFFRNSGNGFNSSLASKLSPMLAFEMDVVIEQGTTGESMFFVFEGSVNIFVEGLNGAPDTHIATVGEGCFFGEVSLLLPVRRTANVVAATTTTLHVLSKNALLASLIDFPDMETRLGDIAKIRLSKLTKRVKSNRDSKLDGTLDKDYQDMRAVALKGTNKVMQIQR